MISYNLILFIALVPFLLSLKTQNLNYRPIIGILTTPSDFIDEYPPDQWSYFTSTYVKFIEAAGGRVVPIPYDAPYTNLTFLFNSINGLFLTGGGANLYIQSLSNNTRTPSNNTAAAAYLLNLAVEANLNGNYFPVWGTCQGWEIIGLVLSQNLFILDNVTNDENVIRNMSFTYKAKESRLWENMDDNLWNWVQNDAITFYAHQNSISVEGFYHNLYIREILEVLSVSYAGYGRWFVASIEGKSLPIYATQFHPEKNTFEWEIQTNAPHSYQAILFEQYCANFFINEVRKNLQSFSDPAIEQASLIYNWNAVQPKTSTVAPCYFFSTVNTTNSAWPNLFGNT